MKFEFIDYSGCFPNLCAGKLTFKADGKQYAGYVDMIVAFRSLPAPYQPEENK